MQGEREDSEAKKLPEPLLIKKVRGSGWEARLLQRQKAERDNNFSPTVNEVSGQSDYLDSEFEIGWSERRVYQSISNLFDDKDKKATLPSTGENEFLL